MYFDSMKLAEPTSGELQTWDNNCIYLTPLTGECKTDYVQFGRDFLFITSHRSNK